MSRAGRNHQQPSRGSRILISVLTTSVVVLAIWVVLSNILLAPRSPAVLMVVAQAPDPVPEPVAAPSERASPAGERTAGIAPAPPAAETPPPEPVEAEAAPLLAAPLDVASADGVPVPVPPMLPSLASSPPRLIELDSRRPEEAVFPAEAPVPVSLPQAVSLPEMVPLPPHRPRAAAIPVPRPRPDIDGTLDRPGTPVLSEAEIARMR